jgi:carbon monoxide dehydrogenase subunit G
MEIADHFRVSTPLDQTWNVLLDIEGIAPCLPGAQLQEIEGNEYRGIVKVKVGPITAQYKGTATLAEVDESGRRIVLDAAGRDTRGQGTAKASIVVTMNDDNGGTRVDIVTDLSITGKVAQFGRGVLDDVSAKLLRQFVENLERDVLAGAAADAADLEVDAPPPVASPPATNGATSTPVTGPKIIDSPEAEPIDLGRLVAGESAARRVVPILLGVVVLFVLWRLLRRRS